MRRHAHAVLDAAVELGLRYIDCARSYGASEEFVSSWMAARARGERGGASPLGLPAGLAVGSKWGYEYTAGWRVHVGDGEVHEVSALAAACLSGMPTSGNPPLRH